MNTALINLAYLVAAVLFIFGLKGLTHPRTAVRGNIISGVGMLVAVVATLMAQEILSFTWIIVGLIIGGAIGLVLAVFIKMTAMPQLVAIFNGFGGIASLLVAGAALITEEKIHGAAEVARNVEMYQFTVATAASGIVGAVTFWGSFIAFVKLQELWWSFMKKLETIPGAQFINGILLLGSVGLGAWVVYDPTNTVAYWAMVAVASVLGVFLVVPIGGADMPVVVALLNSYSGIAAAMTGFVLGNNALIISGSLVGASGVILTQIMCKAMNRSLANVLFGGVLSSQGGGVMADADELYAGKVKSTSADDVAILLDTARRVVFVPGYGLAVAQAQHAVRDLTTLLEERGIEVEFAIHPVAGRMPGHMNVLLAEADIEYDKLKEMDDINPTFSQCDVAIVIGANDVVNPIAREDPNSPIAGMPILNVDQARTVVVIKRSLSPGFAGIPNPLFAADNTLMFFGDGKKKLMELIAAVKEAS